jgi:phosphoribosylanthranilate isomerase
MSKVKVCGVTDLGEALLMESMGVDYLGFNFVKKSPRYISPESAAEIIQELGTEIRVVGVFQNQEYSEISDILKTCPIDLLQFHGNESPEFINKFTLPKIKVFSIEKEFNTDLIFPFEDKVDFFLFDSKVGKDLGGTGKTFDWLQITNIATKVPFFLAGGIGIDNIQDAVIKTLAFAVDLNSKVEFSPGKKDLDLLQSCINKLS